MKQTEHASASGERAQRLRRVKRLVVKIGSSSLSDPGGQLKRRTLRGLVDQVVLLRRQGLEVAIVSSGAVAAGMGRLGLAQRPRAISELQAVAAVGQNLLMHAYEGLFRRHGVPIGQVLLSAGDILDERRRYLNLRNTFRQLFSYGAVPLINENDSVVVAELKRRIGENDMLAAYVANLIQAQLLVILSDVEGLYSACGSGGPSGELIRQVDDIADPRLEKLAGGGPGRLGRGGAQTKIRAAALLMACGEMTIVAHARKHRLAEILAGGALGTLFAPSSKPLQSRKRWIAFASPSRGSVVVDQGAARAIVQRGKSLLPAGVSACRGRFEAGDVIRVENEQGIEIARGLSRYSSAEIERIAGKRSPAVERALGKPAREVIHRDNLVLFERRAWFGGEAA